MLKKFTHPAFLFCLGLVVVGSTACSSRGALPRLGVGAPQVEIPDLGNDDGDDSNPTPSNSLRIGIPAGTSVLVGDPISVAFENFPLDSDGDSKHWVGISTQGSPDNQFLRFKYLPEATSGSKIIDSFGLQGGQTYELRAYLYNSFTVATRMTFTTVANPATPVFSFVPDRGQYMQGDNIVVAYTGFPDSNTNWLSIGFVSEMGQRYVEWAWAPGPSGSVTLPSTALQAGRSYEIRAHFDWQNTRDYFVYGRQLISVHP